MASVTTGLIEKIQIDDHAAASIASTAYGVCETEASVAAKTVDMNGFILTEGITIHVKFLYTNSATTPTLSVNGSDAAPIILYDGVAFGNNAETTSWQPGAIISLTYDGTSWVRD